MALTPVSTERGVALLDVVADVLLAQLKDHAILEDETTKEEVRAYTATPALLTVAIKFLKDNAITMQDTDIDKKLNEVEAALQGRKKHSSNLSNVSYLHPEAANA